MENSSSFANGILGLFCLAAMCLVPLAAIGGGVFYFMNRKKKQQPQPLAVPVPPAPAYQPTPVQPVAVQPVMPEQPAIPVQQPVTDQPAAPALSTVQPVALVQPQVVRDQAADFNATPSELVVLRGEVFAPQASVIYAYSLLGSDIKVNMNNLSRAMYAAAFLSLRQAGDVRFQIGKRKATLGLREIDTLFIIPTGSAGNWPEGSLEARLLATARDAEAKQRNFVESLVYTVLGRDDMVPWAMALNNSIYAIGTRGMLATEEGRGLLGKKVTKWALPPETRSAMAQADVASLQALLSQVQQSEPEVWKLLDHEIDNGVKSRKEADSD